MTQWVNPFTLKRVKELPLTNGDFALVDDVDFYRLARYSWRLSNPNGYVARAEGSSGKKTQKWIALSREIMNPPPGMVVDHKDGNKLNNQRSNLRVCTYQQNRFNTRGKNKCGYIGLRPRPLKDGGISYAASIMWKDGKRKHLGQFRDPKEAARAYDKAALEYHGEFAVLNFPEEHQQRLSA